MNLVNPATGKPFTSARSLTDEQIFGALMEARAGIENMSQQIFNMSIVVEFIMNQLSAYTLPDGSNPLDINVEALAEFGKARTLEIREEMKAMMAEQLQPAAPQLELDLDE